MSRAVESTPGVRPSIAVRVSALVAIVLGATVVVGWYAHLMPLIQLRPGLPAFQLGTALGFVVAGIGLFARSGRRRWLATTCGVIVALIGAVPLLPGQTPLLLSPFSPAGAGHAAHVPPNSALAFVMVGLTLVWGGRSRHAALQGATLGFGVLTVAIGAIATIGHLAGIDAFYGWGLETRMSLHSAMGFVVLGAGCVDLVRRELPADASVRIVPAVGLACATATFLLHQGLSRQAEQAAHARLEILEHAAARGMAGATMPDRLDALWSRTPEVVLVLGLVFSLLTSMLVHVWTLAQRRRRALEAAYAGLERANATLEARVAERTASLEAAETRFRLAAEGSSDGLWDWPVLEEDTMWWSKRLYELIGYEPHELPPSAQTFRDHLHPDDLERTLAAVEDHVAHRVPYDIEYRLLTRSGEYRWFRARGQAVWDANGRPGRMAGSVQDIHDRKLAERELEEWARELARVNRDLESFAFAAAHDLSTPLRGIGCLATWIEEDAASHLPEASLEHVRKIRARVRIMDDLLDALIRYLRAGRDRAEPEPIDTAQLIAETIERVSPPDVFRVVPGDVIPTFTGPRAAAQDVLVALVENAIKHHDRSSGEIRIDVHDRESHVELVVADDGPGIPGALHEQIFDVFRTLEHREETGAVGIGLAVARSIVERERGRIWVESEAERGATFHVVWPKTGSEGVRERPVTATIDAMVKGAHDGR